MALSIQYTCQPTDSDPLSLFLGSTLPTPQSSANGPEQLTSQMPGQMPQIMLGLINYCPFMKDSHLRDGQFFMNENLVPELAHAETSLQVSGNPLNLDSC